MLIITFEPRARAAIPWVRVYSSSARVPHLPNVCRIRTTNRPQQMIQFWLKRQLTCIQVCPYRRSPNDTVWTGRLYKGLELLNLFFDVRSEKPRNDEEHIFLTKTDEKVEAKFFFNFDGYHFSSSILLLYIANVRGRLSDCYHG